jgi:hypothetical protein
MSIFAVAATLAVAMLSIVILVVVQLSMGILVVV